MYVFLGQETVLPLRDVIGIFDLDTTTVEKSTRKFLKTAQNKQEVITVSAELPTSFVLCGKKGKSKIYLSQISSTTLYKRCIQNDIYIL